MMPPRARHRPRHRHPVDAKNANPANGMQAPSGAQVLPLPAPDASTARGPERGNAALKATENPSQSGSTEEGRLSGSEK